MGRGGPIGRERRGDASGRRVALEHCMRAVATHIITTHLSTIVTIRPARVRLSYSSYAPVKELTECAKSHHDVR